MQELPLNGWAVLAAAAAKFIIGGLWFSPALFLKPWIESAGLAGLGQEKIRSGMGVSMVVYAAGSLLMAFVLAHAIKYAQAAHGLPEGVAGGLVGGFINWLGLVAPVQLDAVRAEKKPFLWFILTSGYHLIGMLAMGAILALWA